VSQVRSKSPIVLLRRSFEQRNRSLLTQFIHLWRNQGLVASVNDSVNVPAFGKLMKLLCGHVSGFQQGCLKRLLLLRAAQVPSPTFK
jgi:hypothetical protein